MSKTIDFNKISSLNENIKSKNMLQKGFDQLLLLDNKASKGHESYWESSQELQKILSLNEKVKSKNILQKGFDQLLLLLLENKTPKIRSELQKKLNFLSNKNILIIDLETTGLPAKKPGFHTGIDGYYDYKDDSKYNNCRIVQIAWTLICDFNFDKLENIDIECYIRKPNNFNIPKDAEKIHKISQNIAMKEGIKLGEIINNKGLKKALFKCDYVIAHNVLFDVFILLNELHRIKFNKCVTVLNNLLETNKLICTGEYSKDICKLRMSGPGYKMPKLIELYKFYYDEFPENNHNAKDDVNTIVKILGYRPIKNIKKVMIEV